MYSLTITEKGGQSSKRTFDQPEVTIGRIQGNDIVLPKSNISKRHARIVFNGGSFVVIDSKSTNGTYINGKRIDAPHDMRVGDKIFVGDFTIEVEANATGDSTPKPKKSAPPPPPEASDSADDEAPPPGDAPRGTATKMNAEVLSDDEWGGGGVDDDWSDDWGKDEDSTGSKRPASESADDASGDDEEPPPGAEAKAGRDDDSDDNSDDEVDEEPPPGAAPKTASAPANKAPAAPATSPAKIAGASMPDQATRTSAQKPKAKPKTSSSKRSPDTLGDEASVALRNVHERLLRSLDLRRLGVERMDDDELRDRTRESVEEIVNAMAKSGELPGDTDKAELIDRVLDEALGLGPLEELLADEDVSEILVNGAKHIFVERGGKLQPTNQVFSSDQAVLGVIERIVAPLGRRIDESSPLVDARLKDGSRVNAIIPPLAIDGPTITIRKFKREPLQVDDLVVSGTLTAHMANFLETCVKARKNIIISGGTGSGKTTTLNVLSSFIPSTERILTIEDAAELKLDQEHVVRLEARPANIEGKGAITIRELVRNALRMRPDRIVVGECRGGEALDMLQAMNTGHDGSLTTVHANGPRDALARLDTMVLMSGMDLPVRAIREQVSSAVDIVVQQTRFPDGSRRITHISEITGMEGDVITMQDIFVFEQDGFDGEGRVRGQHKATGFIPRFFETLRAMGLEADLGIFN